MNSTYTGNNIRVIYYHLFWSSYWCLFFVFNCSLVQLYFCFSCTGIGNDEVAALSSGCKKLKKLNLSYCNEVTDRGLQYLSQVKELSDLELRGLVNITGVGLTALAAGCQETFRIGSQTLWEHQWFRVLVSCLLLMEFTTGLLSIFFSWFCSSFMTFYGMYVQSHGYTNSKIYKQFSCSI